MATNKKAERDHGRRQQCQTAVIRCHKALAEVELHMQMGHDDHLVHRQLGASLYWLHKAIEVTEEALTNSKFCFRPIAIERKDTTCI